MNSWSFFEAQRQVEYKAAWKGVPVIHLTKAETRGTTADCARCGERLQSPARDDLEHRRQLRCPQCKRWVDRDVNAVINQAASGLLGFGSSQSERTESEAGEAVKRNAEHDGEPLILRVDASKLISSAKAKGHQNQLGSIGWIWTWLPSGIIMCAWSGEARPRRCS